MLIDYGDISNIIIVDFKPKLFFQCQLKLLIVPICYIFLYLYYKFITNVYYRKYVYCYCKGKR